MTGQSTTAQFRWLWYFINGNKNWKTKNTRSLNQI